MQKHSELSPEIQRQHIDYTNQRWSQLYHLQKEWADKAINLLFVTNSGGAIAMLGFIGARHQVCSFVVWGLGIMLLGIIFVGLLVAHVYHQMTGLFEAWRKSVNEYFLNIISWEKLNEDDEHRSKDPYLNLWLGYGSLSCFIIGIALGVWGLLIGK
ncbi:MAG: hypothetical protein ABSE81_02800 [Candidatus Omnitrophota bacterium]|jgi:hypothetical protein